MTVTALVPLRRYTPGAAWEVVPHSLASPAPDGSVAYYQDALSLSYRDGLGTDEQISAGYDEDIARALCQYLVALTVRYSLQIADGPYLQILEDDGAVPHGWVMLRALAWVEEYDLLTPMDGQSVSM